jgi:hypothetical protein
MGHIKEPAGIDLVIKSRPLTRDEEIAITIYINAYKAKHTRKQVVPKRKVRTSSRKRVSVI